MKKADLQTLLIILLCLAMCFAGCTASAPSGNRIAKSVYPSIEALTLQVMYESGKIENIKDTIGLNPALGDTIVLNETHAQLASGEVLHNQYIWGVARVDGSIPDDIEEDSLFVYFHKVKVIKRLAAHQCIDKTHKTCDGKCSCDGMECP